MELNVFGKCIYFSKGAPLHFSSGPFPRGDLLSSLPNTLLLKVIEYLDASSYYSLPSAICQFLTFDRVFDFLLKNLTKSELKCLHLLFVSSLSLRSISDTEDTISAAFIKFEFFTTLCRRTTLIAHCYAVS